MHLTPVTGGKHSGGHRVGGGIHDHAHGNEGHLMERGNLRDHRSFPCRPPPRRCRRKAASLADAVLIAWELVRSLPQSTAPMRTDRCGQGFAPAPRGGEGRPVRGNDFTRQANISRRQPGIEGAGHAPADERRGAGLDQRCAPHPPPPLPCRSPRRACRHSSTQTPAIAPLDGTQGPRLRMRAPRRRPPHSMWGTCRELSVRKAASAHSGK